MLKTKEKLRDKNFKNQFHIFEFTIKKLIERDNDDAN